jgi:hypothetical protein
MIGAAPGNDRRDTSRLDLRAVLIVVVGTVGEHCIRPPPRPTATTPHRWKGINQRHELGDVVAVAAGQRHLQRDTVPVGDQMVFRARSGTVDLARSRLGHLSSPAHASRRSPPSTSPVGRRRSTQPAATRATGPRPRPCSSHAAAASRSSPIQSPTVGARTPTESRCRGRRECRTGPCGHPAEGDPDGRCDEAPRPATAAGCAPTTHQARSTAAAVPSSRS